MNNSFTLPLLLHLCFLLYVVFEAIFTAITVNLVKFCCLLTGVLLILLQILCCTAVKVKCCGVKRDALTEAVAGCYLRRFFARCLLSSFLNGLSLSDTNSSKFMFRVTVNPPKIPLRPGLIEGFKSHHHPQSTFQKSYRVPLFGVRSIYSKSPLQLLVLLTVRA